MLKQFGWIAGGRVIAAGLQLLTMTMVARYAGPSEFGVLAVILGLTLVAQTCFDRGITTFILRHRAQEDYGDVRGALQVGLRMAALMAVTLAAVSIVAAFLMEFGLLASFLLLALWGSMDRSIDLILAIPTGAGDSTYTTISLVLRRLITVAVLAFFGDSASGALTVFAVSSVCGSALVLLIGLCGAARNGYLSGSKTESGSVLRRSKHYWMSSLAVQLRNLDSLIVAGVSGAYVSGQYGIASRVTTPLRIIPTSFAVALLPHAAKSRTRDLRDLAKPLVGILIISAVLFVALAFAYPYASRVLLGDKYDDSIVAVQIVCISLAIASVESQLTSIMNAWDMSKYVARSAWVSTGCCLVAIGPASMFWGATGAAVVLGGAFMLNAVQLLIWYLVKEKRAEKENQWRAT